MDDLSVKKQDKALIHAKRARNIRTVLIDPKDTAVESAQFRCVFLFLAIEAMILIQFPGSGSRKCLSFNQSTWEPQM